MSFSAAELQKKHALEGAPDPFPTLSTNDSKPVKAKASTRNVPFDTGSEDLFPSLGAGSAPPKQATTPSAWSVRPPKAAAVVKGPQFTESFDLTEIDLRAGGKDGRPTTLGEVMKTVTAKTGAQVEGSTQRNRNVTTFVIKGDSEAAIDKARRLLTNLLSPSITTKVEAPVSSVGSIIGTKGATLKQIRDQTGVRIDIPRKDTNLAAPNGSASGTRTPSPMPDENEDEPEEATVLISVTGPTPSVQEAVEMIKSIIGVRIPKSTQRVKNIPSHIFPFLLARKEQVEIDLQEKFPDAWPSIEEQNKDIVVSGPKEAVTWIIETFNAAKEELTESIKSVSISVPRRQHRLITGDAGEELFNEFGVLVSPDEVTDSVTIWGPQPKLYPALGPILEKSNSETIVSYTLPGTLEVAKQYQTYLIRSSYLRTFDNDHPEVEVHVPSESESEKANSIVVDFSGKNAQAVNTAVQAVKGLVAKLKGGMTHVEVDWALHKLLIGKLGKQINTFQEAHNVVVFFPDEGSEVSTVLLVHDPFSSAGSAKPAEKTKHLEQVKAEFLKVAANFADVTDAIINVDKKWHGAVIGKDGDTVNSVTGEDQSVVIKVGSSAKMGPGKAPLGEDEIYIRGPRQEVERAKAEVERIVEAAIKDELESGYVVEFDVNRDYVGRIVGSQGSAVNRLRDTLSVRIDFSDEVEDKEWSEKGKKRKTSAGKISKVKIVGRKENAEEAKRRILSQVDKFADETSEVIRIPRAYHSGLIGASGKYVTRLEDKYGVKITFPRDSDEYGESNGKTRETLKIDEVLIKGGKKGVNGAKTELLDAAEFEKSNHHEEKFTIPSRAISRILGKGGMSINEIKDNSGAQIDIEKEESSPGSTTVITRGTAQAAKEAKAAILIISDQVGEEDNVTLFIENKFHRNFIGKGGETLKEIISRVGGPSESKAQAGLVHFPRHGEPPDEVHLRGEKKLVKKLAAELEKMAANFRDRVVMGVGVPVAQHRNLIGRGGQHLNDLQTRTGAQIWFPGSRAYASVGEPENDVGDVAPEDLVKVFGARAAVDAAMEELKKPPPQTHSQIRAAARSQPAGESLTQDVTIPLKYYSALTHQGNVIRNIRSLGVTVEQSTIPDTPYAPTRPKPSSDAPARIDEDEPSIPDVEWQIIPNYEGAPEETSVWTLRSREQEALDSAAKLLDSAIEHAKEASHVGFLTLADRSAFPRIVGSKGANVIRLRNETGADITVGRDDNTIVIVGSEDAVEAAKEAILQTANSRRRGE